VHRFLVGALLVCSAATSNAADLHFVIPAGPGGGLDGTARAVGADLQRLGLAASVSYENVTGGGGGRAMSQFASLGAHRADALLINSTPLVIRELQGLFPHSYRDLTPIAVLIADFGAMWVRSDSTFETWTDVIAALARDPRSINFGGGSVRGSLDHVVVALAASAAGIAPRAVRYLPYDGGGKAAIALLGGELDVLSSGVGETLGFLASGDVRALVVSAPSRLPALPGVPAFTELGFDVVVANWRGVFAPAGIDDDAVQDHIQRFERLAASDVWHATRTRHGWDDRFAAGTEFSSFLEAERVRLAAALEQLGFSR